MNGALSDGIYWLGVFTGMSVAVNVVLAGTTPETSAIRVCTAANRVVRLIGVP